jgi:MHS family proline/betaine transporter-like MFS transporter
MMLMARGEMASAVMAMLILGVFIAAFDGASSAAMAELFPTRVRFGGIAWPETWWWRYWVGSHPGFRCI